MNIIHFNEISQRHFEPQRRKGHKGFYLYFLCTPLCAAQRHCAFVVHNILYFSTYKTYNFDIKKDLNFDGSNLFINFIFYKET
jgi:hypothetical protein